MAPLVAAWALGTQDQQLWLTGLGAYGMWGLPRPETQPVSPALAGRFLKQGPPRTPSHWLLDVHLLAGRSSQGLCTHISRCDCVCPNPLFLQEQQLDWTGAHFTDLIYLNYLLKDRMSKHSHILRCWGSEIGHVIWGKGRGHNSALSTIILGSSCIK